MASSDVGENSENLRPYQAMQKELATIVAITGDEWKFDVAASVIDQILTANSAEEIFAANESGPGDVANYLNTPLTIENNDIRYAKSAEKFTSGGLGYYAVFDAITKQGEKVLLSVGASNVVASLRQMQRLGLFEPGKEFWFQIKGRETPNGTLYTVHAA